MSGFADPPTFEVPGEKGVRRSKPRKPGELPSQVPPTQDGVPTPEESSRSIAQR